MEPQKYKKFHFQEIDCLLYFPVQGNSGKYLGYNVLFSDRKNMEKNSEELVKLGDVFERPEVDQKFPHTVGYFKVSCGSGETFKPEYLELRLIRSVEEFWLFLNSLDI